MREVIRVLIVQYFAVINYTSDACFMIHQRRGGIPSLGLYVVGSKSFRPNIQKPRQMENAVRDIQGV